MITLRSLECQPLDLRLHAPFGIAGGAQDVARNVLVRVELASGALGWGEAAPLPAYNGETQGRALDVLPGAAVAVAAKSWADWRDAADAFRSAGGASCGSAQAGFEMALLDALSRERGQSLTTFFGGAETALETDMTITTGSVEEARAGVATIRGLGIRMIKVKVGGAVGGVAHDLARLRAIHALAPEAPLIIDGNAALSRGEAAELAAGLRAAGITPVVLEQWLAKDDLAGMRDLRERTGWPVAADEAVVTADDVRRLAAAGAADIVNIKLMKAGVAAALDVVAAARAARLGLMIGGNVESILAMTVSACFAAGLGGFRHADLDTPLFLAENPFRGGYARTGGVLDVGGITAGHGVEPADRA